MDLMRKMVEHHVWLVGEIVDRAGRLTEEQLDAPIELDREDYGLLQYAFRDTSPLFDEIFHRIKRGDENLEILNWAIDEGIPTEDVIEILEAIDINSRRIECRFAQRLSQAN